MPYIGNKHEIGDHNNSFKTLDDISSYVATFDGSATNAVSTTNNTIRVPEHRFIQGQRVTYSNGGGGNIGGLTSGTAYYIIFDTNNEFKLATSLSNANASTAINLSAVGSGTSHTVTAAFDGVNKKFKITYSGGKSSRFTSATQLSVAINNILQRPNDTTTFTDGFRISDNEKIEFNVAPVASDIFWGSILSASLPTFDVSDNKLDNFTGNGSTTDFTLSHIPANNESVIVTVNGVVQHPTDKNGTRAYSLDASVLAFTAAPANGDEIQVRHIGFAGATSSSVTGFYGRTGNVTLSSSADNAIVGVITATKFSGAFDGTITSGNDIIAGIITATKIDLNGDVDVDGHTELDNVNVAGVITATTFKGNGDFVELDVDGHTNLDNVSISGVTTAAGAIDLNADLDVDGHTNLDNVSVAGVSTFSDKVILDNGSTAGRDIEWQPASDRLAFFDHTKATFGSNVDLQLSHNSSDSIISHIAGATGNLKILSGGAQSIECVKVGAVKIAHNGNTKFETTSSGVSITGNSVVSGNVTAVGGIFSGNVSIGGTLTYEDVTNIDSVGIVTARAGVVDSTLTAGRVVYAGATKRLTDSPNLTYDSLLEIKGTNATLLRLDSSNAQGTSFRIRNSGTDKMYMGLAADFITGQSGNVTDSAMRASGGLLVSTGGGTERLRIDSGGRVGIGTIPVAGEGTELSIRSSDGQTNVGLIPNTNSESSQLTFYNATNDSAQGYIRYDNSNNSLQVRVNLAERLRITSAGKVGIGTDVPDYGLHVYGAGDILIEDKANGSAHLRLRSSNNGTDASNWKIKTSSDNNLYIENDTVGGASQFKIDSSGNLTVVGSTANLFTSNSYNILELRADENNDGGNDDIIFKFTHDGTFRSEMRYDESSSTLEISTADNRDDFSMDTDGKVTFAKDIATAQDYPNQRPTLDLNFAAVKKLDSRITYSRTGPASYIDEYGIVKLVGANTPRFDHDPETRECKGLLIEESRTSRLTQSTGNDSYSHFRQTDRGETIKGPDGVENSAREYTVDSNGSTGGSTTIWGNEAMGFASATSVSCFLKITRGTTMAFRLYDNNNNLESEKITISGGYITDGSYATVVQSDPGSTEGTTTYELYPNGWVRMKWFGASNNANATSYLQLYIYDHAAANSDGDNIGYAVWGFQVENGSYCTSTIPKPTTLAVTRGSDLAYLDGSSGTDFDDIYRLDEGTFVLDWFNNPDGNHNDGYVLTVDDGTGSNRIGAVNSNSYQVTVTSGGSSQGNRDLGSINSGANKMAFTYKLNDQATSLNGSDASVDTSCTLPTGLKYIWFGFRQGQYDFLGGYISRIIYYSKRLPNNQLKNLSS